ncbi:MAG: ABC transporter ATP-binding protein, partial [Lachnospiraceae bacterium]|nr:ABC transporter ATP-binding protein [Lachnospiraceae bacterium]
MEVNTIKKDEETVSVGKAKTVGRLLKYLFDYTGLIIGVLIVIGIGIAIKIVNPLIIERAINVNVAEKDTDGLVKLAVVAIVLNVLAFVLTKVRMYYMAKMSNDVVLRIRKQLFEHIQTLSFSFFDSRPTGKILARLMGDVKSLRDVLTNFVSTLLPEFVTVITVVIIMFVKNTKLALAAMVSLPLMMGGIWLIQTVSHKRWQIFRKKASNLNAFIHEDVSGMRVIQSFNAEKETAQTFDILLDEHFNSFRDAVRVADAFGSVTDFSWGIASFCLYFVGVKVIGGDVTQVGTLIAFSTYVSMFWNPIMRLGNFYNQLITNITGAERIFEILDTKPEISDKAGVEELPEIKGEVEFSHVSFAYDEKTKVLEDVSFKVKPGETIALVGPTGAGKSTIVNLISRFYDIQEGNIYIDGHNIKDVSVESLRDKMGIMT